VLQWAREQDCPWDADTCSDAARGGHLEVLKWAWEHGCPFRQIACSQATAGGNEDMQTLIRQLWLQDVNRENTA